MVGGGSRRDDGPLKISSSNVFAALETLKKKKKSNKELKSKGSSKSGAKESEPQVFWAPTPLTAKSWADVDDDDDYFATTAPPQTVWGLSEQQQNKEAVTAVEEESESEEDGLDIGDDDVEEEPENETEVAVANEQKWRNLFRYLPKMQNGNCQRRSLRKKKWQNLMHFYMSLAFPGKIIMLHKMRQMTRNNMSKVVMERKGKHCCSFRKQSFKEEEGQKR
ncbi:unnamed protein product [Musa textilis]